MAYSNIPINVSLDLDVISNYTQFDRLKSPRLNEQESQQLKDSISRNGVQKPIFVELKNDFSEILVTEGNHRVVYSALLNFKEIPCEVYKVDRIFKGQGLPVRFEHIDYLQEKIG